MTKENFEIKFPFFRLYLPNWIIDIIFSHIEIVEAQIFKEIKSFSGDESQAYKLIYKLKTIK